MSEIRYDVIHDEYSLVAPERLHRPNYYAGVVEARIDETIEACPFCEGKEYLTPPEIFAIRSNKPNMPGWKVRVIPNLYKAVQIETPFGSKEAGLYEIHNGFGAHEVIIDTPRHLLRLDKMSKDEYFNWLYTLRLRLADLRNDKRMVYFSIFKNHGFSASATQVHPHTQLIALPVVPKSKLNDYNRAFDYHLRNNRSLFDSVIQRELNEAKRIIYSDDEFLVFAPFASRFAFEVSIISKQNGFVSLLDLNDKNLNNLAKLLLKIMNSLYRQLGNFDFNLIFNTPPMQKTYATERFYDRLHEFWRFQISITPRLFGLGGFEIDSCIYINPVLPEDAAGFLRRGLEE
ncbi:galactose-1-phosphate uridylyltransferase [Hippea maritima]|uniref:Galactose-1-phosphate uridylyltransferase n=1 Tax=Hippea maritima (strain ATCC 700847 / DSM 10411 / MH2) TaxID=760142 RepID=F2LVZ2_HIPMA|nr:galactose-1-phosphate uridylyltransferase [Hippea maritima]AEA33926.1 galactose-1-phosphate uridylyltransferase [Hippea maritima DSM 10411]